MLSKSNILHALISLSLLYNLYLFFNLRFKRVCHSRILIFLDFLQIVSFRTKCIFDSSTFLSALLCHSSSRDQHALILLWGRAEKPTCSHFKSWNTDSCHKVALPGCRRPLKVKMVGFGRQPCWVPVIRTEVEKVWPGPDILGSVSKSPWSKCTVKFLSPGWRVCELLWVGILF